MSRPRFRMLYSDIGGVLGTNGWDAELRRLLCTQFALPLEQIEGRHRLTFDSFERGHLTFEEYLQRVIFTSPRKFSFEEIRDFAFEYSQPWPENIEFFQNFCGQNQLGLALISNEGQGITQHRIEKFGLREVCDFMVISHFTGLRKPDREIWELALNLAQVSPSESIYIDDREMFVDVAADLGFTAIHHTDIELTKEKLVRLGLRAGGEV